jgi:23S rRNA pseudouridine1911/1915/1917 synthase
VSGVMLFARTSKSLERLTAMMRERQIEKTYWAIVKNKPPALHDDLIHHLKRETGKNITKAFQSRQGESKEARLTYKMLKSVNGFYLLEIIPHTGRQHQIRAQLSAIGCPIVGDVKYGYPKPLPDASIALHSRKIEFLHPVKNETLVIEAPLPKGENWNDFR